jgi:hypothetical protein
LRKYERSLAIAKAQPLKINRPIYFWRTGAKPWKSSPPVPVLLTGYFTVSWTVVLWVTVPPASVPVKVSVNVPWLTFWFADSVTVDEIGAPCRVSLDGETVHVELGGAPEQLRATEPVNPLTGVIVMV